MAVIDNLVFSLSMDEASGNAIDDHSTNDFTETGGTIASAAGKVGTSREFILADTEYFDIADNSEVSGGDIDWSFECWVYLNFNNIRQVFIGKDIDTPGGSRDFAFYYEPSNPGLVFWIDGTTAGTVNYGVTLSTATWYHLTFGHSASSNELWVSVDAATPNTSSTTGPATDSGAPLHIGSRAYPGFEDYLDGRIDEVRMWKRDIRSDLTWLYNSGNGRSYADIVAEGGGGGDVSWMPQVITSGGRIIKVATSGMTPRG